MTAPARVPPSRLAGPADAGAVAALAQAAYAHYVPRMGRRPAPMDADYAALIAAGRVHVAELDGAISGVLVLVPEGETLLLDNVAVAPHAQGRGIGRALLAFAEAEARAAGCTAIRLYTNEAMVENIALYGRAGYVETRRGEEAGFRRVHMEKRLT
ncbi:MAG: GNAT family N-acetyltransferase [Pseudomonadota bacterium]